MSPWLVYWVLMLDKIQAAVGVVVMLSFIGGLLSTIALVVVGDAKDVSCKTKKTMKKTARISVVMCCFFSLILMFMPGTKEAAAIYLIPKMYNNKDMQALPANLVKYANQYIVDELKTT